MTRTIGPVPGGDVDNPVVDRRELPQRCGVCARAGDRLRQVLDGAWECGVVDCPHRRPVTARPSVGPRKE